MSSQIPYPYNHFEIDTAGEQQAERAAQAREAVDPSDLLAVTQHLMLEIADDTKHPLWPLIQHCATIGTFTETGQLPHLAEQVGAAFLPLIDKAITRLVTEALLEGED
jgi:hypothetical protein